MPTTGTKCEMVKRLEEAGVPSKELFIIMGSPPTKESLRQQDEHQEERASAQTAIPTTREIELLRRERNLAKCKTESLRKNSRY